MLPRTCLEIRDLRLIYAIVEAGGATRAARSLNLSQSAVSHQLRNLEQRLGVTLFERRQRALRVTEAGERLCATAREVLGPLSRVERELRDGAVPVHRELRVSTQCYTAYHWLPQVLDEFRVRHPDVQITIVSEATQDPLAALRAGALDLALCMGVVKSRNLVQRPLLKDELWVVMPEGHRFAGRAFLEPEELAEETMILYNLPSSAGNMLRKLLFPRGGAFSQVIRMPLTEAILELVKARVGISILANWAVAHRVARGEFVSARLTRRGLQRQWSGVYPRSSALQEPIRSLLSLLKELGLAVRSSA